MRFIFVGKGKYLKRIMEYARESGLGKYVIFTGELYDLPEVYSIFDIFVLPSFWEGMPYVLLEAIASKIPVICSSLPGLNEVIMNNFSALTIDPFNMDDLFKKISILYSNEDLRYKLNANAFEAVKKYDEKMLIKDYEKIYTEVIGT